MVGDGKKSADVFTITNSGSEAVQLDIEAKGEVKPFVDRIRLGEELLPAALAAGSTSSVAIDLEIPADAAPGDYSGTIRVTTADGSFSVDIPVTFTVVPLPDETPPLAEDPTVPPADPVGEDVTQPTPDEPVGRVWGRNGDAAQRGQSGPGEWRRNIGRHCRSAERRLRFERR